MEIFNHNSNVPFLHWRRISIVIAGLLMIASVALLFTRGLNYGLDFTGGISVEVKYERTIDIGDVRQALDEAGIENPVVQSLGGSRQVLIRLQPKADGKGGAAAPGEGASARADKVAAAVMAALKKR